MYTQTKMIDFFFHITNYYYYHALASGISQALVSVTGIITLNSWTSQFPQISMKINIINMVKIIISRLLKNTEPKKKNSREV